MSPAEQSLAAIIDSCQPKTIVTLGGMSARLAHRWSEHDSCEVTCLTPEDTSSGLSLPEVQDLALVTDTLEHLTHGQGQRLIGLLRNYGTRHIAVLVDPYNGWSQTDFIGLGFTTQSLVEGEGEGEPLALYTYNISRYNHKRTWNNPRFWANPHMWDKARW